MSKGFIGLDNPSFQGNLRTHRQSRVVRPQRHAVQNAAILDDVKDSDKYVEQTVVQSKASPKSIKESRNPSTNKHISPLQTPAWHTSPAGSEISVAPGLRPAEKRVPRSERFRQWQQEQRIQPAPDAVEHNYEQPAQVVGYEFEAQPQVEQQPIVQIKKRSLRSRIPYFGGLTRKDLLTMRFALPTMAIAIFLIGCGVSIQGVLTNRHVKAQVAELSGSGDATGYDPSGKEEVPDETKPDPKTWGPYIVAPDMPKYIRINRIGVNSRVMRVGVKPNNELIAPNNIHNVGWFEGSAKPGEKGAALMDAHVHGPTMPGAFYKVHELNPGDQVEVEMGDGRKFTYEVKAKESKPYQDVDMAKAMRSIEDGKNGLNMITCGGKYNRAIHMYEERVVVYAVQI